VRASLFLTLALAAPVAWAQNAWEPLYDEDGIKVWRKEVPNSDFVAFRGIGKIRAPLLNVAAVIHTADREEEWMANCSEARVLGYTGRVDAYVYHRVGSPAPFVADRDTVLKTKTQLMAAEKSLKIEFENTVLEKMGPVEDVVRMPTLKGHWILKQVDTYTTEVEYQVQADPGGALPAWLVNLVSKKLPLETLKGLRRQVEKSGYESSRAHLERSLDWTGFDFPATEATVGPGAETTP